MGVLTASHGKKRYLLELEEHGKYSETELPLDRLQAVFLEGYTPDALSLEAELNHGIFTLRGKSWKKDNDIIKKAANNKVELWFGDAPPTSRQRSKGRLVRLGTSAAAGGAGYAVAAKLTRRQLLRGLAGLATITATSPIPYAMVLSRPGGADERNIARAVVETHGKISPEISARDFLIAHKVAKLAQLTGHTRIGLSVGAGHVNIAKLLENHGELTTGQRREISAMGKNALKLFRCTYNTKRNRWNVEEHAL